MTDHNKINHAACLISCQPDSVRSGRIGAGTMNFRTPLNSRLKTVAAVLTNFGLILHDFCAVWASFGRNSFRFVKFNLCVGGGHYRERYRNSRQQKAKNHPSNRAAAFATGNSSAQDPVNKTNNKYNHSTISPLVNQWREDATKFQSRKILRFLSPYQHKKKVKQHETS